MTDLLDEDGIRRSTGDLTATINEGIAVLSMLTQACETTTTMAHGAATQTHSLGSLSPAFFSAVAVYWNSVRLFPVRMSDLDQLNPSWLTAAASTPSYYFTVGALGTNPLLYLYPTPLLAGTITLSYSGIAPNVVSSSDIPALPREHHYAVVWWAYAWELLKERGPLFVNKAFQIFGRFLQAAQELQLYIYRRTPDRDWQMPPLDMEAIRKKIRSVEQTVPQTEQQVEAQQLGQ